MYIAWYMQRVEGSHDPVTAQPIFRGLKLPDSPLQYPKGFTLYGDSHTLHGGAAVGQEASPVCIIPADAVSVNLICDYLCHGGKPMACWFFARVLLEQTPSVSDPSYGDEFYRPVEARHTAFKRFLNGAGVLCSGWPRALLTSSWEAASDYVLTYTRLHDPDGGVSRAASIFYQLTLLVESREMTEADVRSVAQAMTSKRHVEGILWAMANCAGSDGDWIGVMLASHVGYDAGAAYHPAWQMVPYLLFNATLSNTVAAKVHDFIARRLRFFDLKGPVLKTAIAVYHKVHTIGQDKEGRRVLAAFKTYSGATSFADRRTSADALKSTAISLSTAFNQANSDLMMMPVEAMREYDNYAAHVYPYGFEAVLAYITGD